MAAQPIGPQPARQPAHWYASPTFSSSYRTAALRAGAIALVLLVILAAIVLT
ncbi:hypothetical protein [Mycolicibacterium mengxianglii]|uniref:hypothetical protein n=1 Tax=Mycolicibacterium mengxianglii TaxID=2736649 RepID=UPI0018D106E2|nr:hypothetical protein [Mycolicibacterium mengxianglii]